eukprot:TRINITY_DN3985_c0_g1_i1.p2 TRINITY_DN3985_c0_g1~~TRINITY_DN3985_c0_g1_i1.p2  ORF type:complete len:363 (-),score=67.86 TRINITY_DN3985_c0_g1_i1:242-1330(-)
MRKDTKQKQQQNSKLFLENFGTFQKAHGFLRIHTRIVEALVTASKEPIFRSRLEAEQNLLALSSVDSSLQFVEKCIRKREPVTKVLRILSLYSLTNGGIEQSKLEQLRLMIMKTYGYGFLPTIENLTKLGMIECSNNMYSYKQLKKDLSLITLDMDVHDPKDFAYVYSGFSPISVRLIEKIGSVPVPSESNNVVVNTNSTSGAGGRGRGGVPGRGAPGRGVPGRGRQDGRGRAKPQIVDEFDDDDMIGPQEKVIVLDPDTIITGWGNASVDGVLNKCRGGRAFRAFQSMPKGDLKQREGNNKKYKVVLVVFVGGCTYAEISAIRFLSKRSSLYKFLIVTTKIINGNTLIESVIDKLPKAHVS